MRKGLLLLLFLFLIPLGSAVSFECDSVVYYEDFDYSDVFTNHGYGAVNWVYSTGNAQDNETPITSVFANNAFGINHNVSGGSYTASIRFPDDTFQLTGQVIVKFNFSHQSGEKSYVAIGYNRTGTTDQSTFIAMAYDGAIGNISIGVGDVSPDCTLQYNRTEGLITVEFDTEEDEVSLYVDDEISNCKYIDIPNLYAVEKIQLYREQSNGETAYKFIDDLTFCEAIDVTYEYGTPCESNEECDSGKCENGYCVLKLGGEDCTSNSQCRSGNCVNGKCTKPSTWQLLDASKSEQFGDDSHTNNFISLFLMVGLACAIIFGGGRSGLAVLGGILVFIVLGFFFALVGWLSPFILLGIILACLVMFVVFMIMKGNA